MSQNRDQQRAVGQQGGSCPRGSRGSERPPEAQGAPAAPKAARAPPCVPTCVPQLEEKVQSTYGALPVLPDFVSFPSSRGYMEAR